MKDVSYQSAIGSLIYAIISTQVDIASVVIRLCATIQWNFFKFASS